MHSTSERLRIILSRLAAVFVAFFLFTTQSRWQINGTWVATLLFSAGIGLATIAALGRMWCSLFIAGYKDDQLYQLQMPLTRKEIAAMAGTTTETVVRVLGRLEKTDVIEMNKHHIVLKDQSYLESLVDETDHL